MILVPKMSTVLLAALLSTGGASAFAPSSVLCVRRFADGSRGATSAPSRSAGSSAKFFPALFAGTKSEGDDEDKREGMKDAFAALDALSSLDDEDGSKPPEVGMVQFDGSPEEEAQMMSDMMAELETQGEEGMYSSVLGEMGAAGGAEGSVSGQSTAGVGFARVLDDADGIGSSNDDDTLLTYKPDEGVKIGEDGSAIGEPDMEQFMAKAIREAVDEARSKTPDEIKAAGPKSSDSILEDEQMMKDINDLFDDANQKLVESIKEIQVEQAALAKKSAQDREDAVKESEMRLAEAEAGAARIMDTVMKETAEVERALADLEAAKNEVDADPMTKMADLKGGGIVKQAAFVGAFLFSIRAVGEIAQMAGPGGEAHGTAAAVQGIIAAACAVYLALG